MDDHEEAPSGRVYSLADGPRAVPTDSACCITNGPAVSPDGRFLSPVDTLDRKIWRHQIGPPRAMARGEVRIEIADGAGPPDRAPCDSPGNVWQRPLGGRAGALRGGR